jgi:carotenoid cleavage dioxygenase
MTSPYLQGNFAPVREEVSAARLSVVGELPRDLHGQFVRNGPNPQFAPKGRYHWFDGDGMLHGVHLAGGEASYRNRYVQTQGFSIERAAGHSVWGGLLDMPDLDAPHGMMFKNAANTALAWHDGRLLALWEGGPPHEIKTPSLDTVGAYDFGGALEIPFTAHPKIDPETGEMVFFGYSPAAEPYASHGVVSAQGKLLRTVPIALPAGVMMHDFAITARYSLFLDLPFEFRLDRVFEGKFPFVFDRERPSRYGLFPRHATDSSALRWFEGPSCFVWHTLNAYEEGDEVVLLACRVSDTNALLPPEDSASKDTDAGRLHRWRFNLSTGTTREEPLDEVQSEFPRINDAFMGRKNRYGYAGRISGQDGFDGALKYDLETGRSWAYGLGPGRVSGEWVFAPRDGATAEDDGYLLSFVFDRAENRSELVILRAQDITQGPVARVLLPVRVPYGFHGIWLPAAQVGAR